MPDGLADESGRRLLQLRPEDVVFGKGPGLLQHPGNRTLLELIRQRLMAGDTAPVRRQAEAVRLEVRAGGGRFVALVPGTALHEGQCTTVPADRAHAKIAYTFYNEAKKARARQQRRGQLGGRWTDTPAAADTQRGLSLTPRPSPAPQAPPGAPLLLRLAIDRSDALAAGAAGGGSHVDVATAGVDASGVATTDVVLGRSDHVWESRLPGNVAFLDRVRTLLSERPQAPAAVDYQHRRSRHSTMTTTMHVAIAAQHLVATVHALDPPGRFLLPRCDGNDVVEYPYLVVSDERAVELVGTLLEDLLAERSRSRRTFRVGGDASYHYHQSLHCSDSPLGLRWPVASALILDERAAAKIMVDIKGATTSGVDCMEGPRCLSWIQSNLPYPLTSHPLQPVDLNTPDTVAWSNRGSRKLGSYSSYRDGSGCNANEENQSCLTFH